MENYEQWLIDFGGRLRTIREQKSLSRQELALQVGVAQDFIAQIERGNRSPSLQTLMFILDMLNISADSLLYDSNAENNEAKSALLHDFNRFLSRREHSEIVIYFEIIQLIARNLKI